MHSLVQMLQQGALPAQELLWHHGEAPWSRLPPPAPLPDPREWRGSVGLTLTLIGWGTVGPVVPQPRLRSLVLPPTPAAQELAAAGEELRRAQTEARARA